MGRWASKKTVGGGEFIGDTNQASLPIAWRLYLPQEWADDTARRKQAGIPEEVPFNTKPAIALQQIRAAAEQGVPQAPVLADAAYGTDGMRRLVQPESDKLPERTR